MNKTYFTKCILAMATFTFAMQASADICNRSKVIQISIENELGIFDCRQVTDAHLASLESLHLDAKADANQPLRELQRDDLRGLTSLKELYLSDLGQFYRDTRPTVYSLPVGIFDGLNSLEKLSLDNTALDNLPAGIFRGLSNLKTLWLFSNSNLNEVPIDLLSGLSSLQVLDLSGNPTLGQLPLKGLGKLEHLDLSYCEVSALPNGSLRDLVSLKFLDLRENQVQSISRADTGLVDGVTVWGVSVLP